MALHVVTTHSKRRNFKTQDYARALALLHQDVWMVDLGSHAKNNVHAYLRGVRVHGRC
jgi:hypothetical protein